MSPANILIIAIIAVAVVVLLIWVFRSRTGRADHLDTSATAVGGAAEAVRNMAEDVAHKVEGALKSDGAPSEASADVQVAPSHPGGVTESAGTGSGSAIGSTAAPAPVSTAPAATAGAGGLTDIGVPAAVGAPDNLRQLKGVGPKLQGLLTQLGITRFDQIAAWGDADIALVDAHLGSFKGRIRRDDWVEQARLLASGDIAAYEARFGKLDAAGGN